MWECRAASITSGSPMWVVVMDAGCVFKSRRGHQCGHCVVYVYIETTTYRSDSQAFIVVTHYTDGFTADRRLYDVVGVS
jgi:hypothetical protein